MATNSTTLAEKLILFSTNVTTVFILIVLPIVTTENCDYLQSDVHPDLIGLLVFHHG